LDERETNPPTIGAPPPRANEEIRVTTYSFCMKQGGAGSTLPDLSQTPWTAVECADSRRATCTDRFWRHGAPKVTSLHGRRPPQPAQSQTASAPADQTHSAFWSPNPLGAKVIVWASAHGHHIRTGALQSQQRHLRNPSARSPSSRNHYRSEKLAQSLLIKRACGHVHHLPLPYGRSPVTTASQTAGRMDNTRSRLVNQRSPPAAISPSES